MRNNRRSYHITLTGSGHNSEERQKFKRLFILLSYESIHNCKLSDLMCKINDVDYFNERTPLLLHIQIFNTETLQTLYYLTLINMLSVCIWVNIKYVYPPVRLPACLPARPPACPPARLPIYMNAEMLYICLIHDRLNQLACVLSSCLQSNDTVLYVRPSWQLPPAKGSARGLGMQSDL